MNQQTRNALGYCIMKNADDERRTTMRMMSKLNKEILAMCIMGNAGQFEHPVLGVDVRDRYVYIFTELPEAAGGRGVAECVCYAHHCENIDLSKIDFSKGSFPLRLTPHGDDETVSLQVH